MGGGGREAAAHARRMAPSMGVSGTAIIRSVVVLPNPDGPSMEKNSPDAIEKSASATAT